MTKPITTAKNYDFVTDCFIQAKAEKKHYLELCAIHGSSHPISRAYNDKRLKGCTLEGASRTSKTFDTCIFICQYIKKYSGKRVTIARDTLANLKDTTYQTLKQVWYLFGYDLSLFNKAATGFEYKGNQFSFLGINDNIMKSHGHESDLLFINEVMGIPKDVVDQLEQRNTEFFIYDFNPSAFDHWVFDYENRDDVRTLHTTIFDNPYAPANAVSKILSYAHPDTDDFHIAEKIGYTLDEWNTLKAKNVLLNTADKYKWEVYGLGLRSVSDDVIFQNIQLYSKQPESYEWELFGLDFGYSTDETAVIKVIKNGHQLYLREYVYQTGLLNNDIATKLKELNIEKGLYICDTSPAQNVNELRMLNINATPYPNKKPGSKEWGIQQLQQAQLFIHVDSTNLLREFKKYRWAKMVNGDYKRNTLGQRVAVDKDDHGIQAAIYAATYFMSVYENE